MSREKQPQISRALRKGETPGRGILDSDSYDSPGVGAFKRARLNPKKIILPGYQMIRVSSPQELRSSRSAVQAMSETTAFFAANPSEALRFGLRQFLPRLLRRTPGTPGCGPPMSVASKRLSLVGLPVEPPLRGPRREESPGPSTQPRRLVRPGL